MDFKAFDRSKLDEYSRQAKELYGSTPEYKEMEKTRNTLNAEEANKDIKSMLVDYKNTMMTLNVGDNITREEVMLNLINMFYERNNLDLKRGTFRARGDILEIMPVNEHGKCIRIDFFGDEIEKIYEIDTVTGSILNSKNSISLFAASHF